MATDLMARPAVHSQERDGVSVLALEDIAIPLVLGKAVEWPASLSRVEEETL